MRSEIAGFREGTVYAMKDIEDRISECYLISKSRESIIPFDKTWDISNTLLNIGDIIYEYYYESNPNYRK